MKKIIAILAVAITMGSVGFASAQTNTPAPAQVSAQKKNAVPMGPDSSKTSIEPHTIPSPGTATSGAATGPGSASDKGSVSASKAGATSPN